MSAFTPADQYRAIYLSLWRLNERHDCRVHARACNDNGGR